MKKAALLFIVLILVIKPSHAQLRIVDSLKQVLQASVADTDKIKALNVLSRKYFLSGEYDSSTVSAARVLQWAAAVNDPSKRPFIQKEMAIAYSNLGNVAKEQNNYASAFRNFLLALSIRRKTNDRAGIASCINNLGNIYSSMGQYPLALKNYLLALQIRKQLGDKENIAGVYSNIGIVYYSLGNYTEALKNQISALKLREDINNALGIAACYNNIGNIYSDQNNYAEALANHRAALKIRKAINDPQGIAYSYNNMAIIYEHMDKFKEALENNFASLQLMQAMNNKQGEAASLNNIGNVYRVQGQYEKALKYYLTALKISEAINDLGGMINALANVGLSQYHQKKYGEAEKNSLKAKTLAGEAGILLRVKEVNENLSLIYNATGKYKEALKAYKAFVVAGDSLTNEANTKKTVQQQMQYEFDKRESMAKMQQQKKEAVTLAERVKQKIILYTVSGIGVLVLCFAFFAYRSYLQKRKANIEITLQKHLIEEKQKEILDSIHYARRIQQSLLTHEKYIQRNLGRLKNTA